MATTTKKKKKRNYLTKEITKRAGKKGLLKASKNAMADMGYIVIAQNGWVVKKFPDGSTIKLTRIDQVNLPDDDLLD